MGGSIVKLSVLLSANASQATTTIRDFANEAQRTSLKAQTAFNGQPLKVTAGDGIMANAKAVYESTRTAAEKYKETLTGLDILKARGAIGANTYSRAVAQAGQEMRQATSSGSGLLNMVGGIKGAMIGATTAGIGLAGVMGVKAAVANEQAAVTFETLLKSASGAKKMMADLQKFAISTPFEFSQVRSGAQQMLAYGIAARDVIPMLRIVGDAASAAPQGMVEGLERVTRALGQMRGRGKVSSQEMLQLTEAGIGAWDMLAKGIGRSVAETQKLVEDGSVNSATGIKALLDGMQSQFGGNMEKQSATVLGKFSNLKDQLGLTLGQIASDTMKALNINGMLQSAADGLASLREHWKSVSAVAGSFFKTVSDAMPPFTGRLLAITAGAWAFANVIRVVGTGVIGLAANVKMLGLAVSTALGPWTLLATGITAAAGAITYFVSKSREAKAAVDSFAQAQNDAAEIVEKRHGMHEGVMKDNSPNAWWKSNKALAKEMADELDKILRAMGKLGPQSTESMQIVQGAMPPTLVAIKAFREELRKSVEEMGMSAEMKKFKEISKMPDVTMQDRNEMNQEMRKKWIADDRKKMFEDGAKLVEDMRTPYETLSSEMSRFNNMLNSGAITWQTYERAVGKANEKFREQLPLTKLMTDQKKQLQEAIDKASLTDGQLLDKQLRNAGASPFDRMQLGGMQLAKERYEAEKKLRDEADAANKSQLTGLAKYRSELEHVKKLWDTGRLSVEARDGMLKKAKEDALNDLKKKNEITSPGLALAGSQEAYKAMVASTQVNSSKSEETNAIKNMHNDFAKKMEENTKEVRNGWAELKRSQNNHPVPPPTAHL